MSKTNSRTSTLRSIHWDELDKGLVAVYTGKWFLIWTFKIFCVAIMAACALFALFFSVMPKPKE